MTKVPVIVLTGFLGSGKTTLLNRVLARRAARPADGTIGVIVNELGAIGIDADLLAAGGPRQVELAGGCVCCVLGEELDRTVLDLIASTPGLDAIVLETTGVAEPLPIAWAFGRAPVSNAARLAAIVTLVDTTGFIAARGLSPAVDEQVLHADVIVTTKSELVGESERWAVLHQIRALAPDAPLVEGTTDHAAAWLDGVIRSAGTSRLERDLESGEHDAHADEHAHAADDGHAHPHAAHGIDSVSIEIPDVLDLEELEDQLATLPGNFIRIKGIALAVDGRIGETTPRWVAFHRVGLRVSSEPISGPSKGRVVGLGPGVERGPLAACIEAAVLSSPDGGAHR